MKSATLLLHLADRAVFSKRGATEGEQTTLDYIPGATLLGWAARNYSDFDDAFKLFHSGSVRFSNALPLAGDGTVAYPTPQILMQAKGVKDGPLWAGRPTGQDNVQFEAKRGGFISRNR